MDTPARTSPRWENPRTVAGFVSASPNEVLLAFARMRLAAAGSGATCLDIGCGAARNTLPLAAMGWDVAATDLSAPMLAAAAERVRAAPADVAARVRLVLAPMAPLPFADASFDLVVAHGVWNLARTGDEFRAAVAEAARVARPGAGLFLFTFSRATLPAAAVPDPGETFVFSSWNGDPCTFLTEAQVLDELARAGFRRTPPGVPLTTYNAPRPGEIRLAGAPPVIHEGTFLRA